MRPALFGDAQLGPRVRTFADRVAARDEDEQIAATDRRANRQIEFPARWQVLAIEEHIDVGAFQCERDPLRELALLVGVADENLHGRVCARLNASLAAGLDQRGARIGVFSELLRALEGLGMRLSSR